jgi:competence protein ComEA
MAPERRGALPRLATRVTSAPLAKPVTRVVLTAAGLLLLAFIGRTAVAGAHASPAASTAVDALQPPAPAAAEPASATPVSPAASAPSPPPTVFAPSASPRARASPDDPVVLNIATTDDLRRLPGIGAKRADAILALRQRLGRFRAADDLLKVKGIGRATLRRLRPLLRVDSPPAQGDGGPQAPARSTGG